MVSPWYCIYTALTNLTLRYDPVIVIGRSHSANADHDGLIRSRQYETKQFIANWIMTSFTGKFRIEITWSWLNEKRQTDIYSWRHNGKRGNVIYDCRMRASWPVQCTHTLFAHDTTRFGHAIFDRCVCVINVIENIQNVDTRQTMFQ